MVLKGEAQKLKMIIGEEDMVYQRPLFEAIVFAAKKYKMAGITVSKGIISYGADSIISNSKVFTISPERPVIIELIDRAERINSFAEIATKLLEKANCGGLIFAEEVHVFLYKSSKKITTS
jgi:PII-like signaling protein